MKILFLTHYDNMYGANRALFGLMKGLRETYQAELILVIPAAGEMTQEAEKIGIRCIVTPVTQWQAVYRLPLRFQVKKYKRRGQIAEELDRLEELLLGEKIDLIHSNSSVIGTGAMLARRLECRHVWHIREFSREHFGMEYFYPEAYVRSLYEEAACLIAISDAVKENYRKRYPGANVIRIYDGTEPYRPESMETGREEKKMPAGYEADSVSANPGRPVRFVYVGYLFPKKHQMEVLEAAAQLRNMRWTGFEIYFIGNGKPEYEEKLRKRAKSCGLTNVKFLGYRSDVSALLETMDVGIIASEYEGFGLVTVEYMMHGLPVIGRASGATPEIIEDGITGCLYESTDGLVKAMKYLMEHGSRRKEMGERGRERALAKFTEQQNTRSMMKLYEMLLDTGRKHEKNEG